MGAAAAIDTGSRLDLWLFQKALTLPLARLEPYGMLILTNLIFLAPLLGAEVGVNLNIISRRIAGPTNAILALILWVPGNS